MAKKKKKRFVEDAIGLAAGGAAFGVGASVIDTLPQSSVSDTALSSLGVGATVLPVAAGGMVLRELSGFGELKKKRKKKRR